MRVPETITREIVRKGGLGNPSKMRVLMYHRILSKETNDVLHEYCVKEREFRRQLELLDQWGFTAITFNDYRLYLAGELNLPKKPVILTFDDGYLETYEIAYPILESMGMKAVIFVLGDPNVKTSIWDRRYQNAVAPLMNQQQILELHSAGFEIGSHALHHPRLPSLPEEKAWEEISRSRELLEIMINAPVRTFAYPYGLANDKIKRMVKDAGYATACSGWTGPATFGVDLFEIRRISMVNSIGMAGFAFRMFGPYQMYRWYVWKTKSLLGGKNAPPMVEELDS